MPECKNKPIMDLVCMGKPEQGGCSDWPEWLAGLYPHVITVSMDEGGGWSLRGEQVCVGDYIANIYGNLVILRQSETEEIARVKAFCCEGPVTKDAPDTPTPEDQKATAPLCYDCATLCWGGDGICIDFTPIEKRPTAAEKDEKPVPERYRVTANSMADFAKDAQPDWLFRSHKGQHIFRESSCCILAVGPSDHRKIPWGSWIVKGEDGFTVEEDDPPVINDPCAEPDRPPYKCGHPFVVDESRETGKHIPSIFCPKCHDDINAKSKAAFVSWDDVIDLPPMDIGPTADIDSLSRSLGVFMRDFAEKSSGSANDPAAHKPEPLLFRVRNKNTWALYDAIHVSRVLVNGKWGLVDLPNMPHWVSSWCQVRKMIESDYLEVLRKNGLGVNHRVERVYGGDWLVNKTYPALSDAEFHELFEIVEDYGPTATAFQAIGTIRRSRTKNLNSDSKGEVTDRAAWIRETAVDMYCEMLEQDNGICGDMAADAVEAATKIYDGVKD